jgi:hypothetical protein
MSCTPIQRAFDKAQSDEEVRQLWLSLGLTDETIERAIAVSRQRPNDEEPVENPA